MSARFFHKAHHLQLSTFCNFKIMRKYFMLQDWMISLEGPRHYNTCCHTNEQTLPRIHQGFAYVTIRYLKQSGHECNFYWMIQNAMLHIQ